MTEGSPLPRELLLIIDDIVKQDDHLLEWEVFGNTTEDMRAVLTWRCTGKRAAAEAARLAAEEAERLRLEEEERLRKEEEERRIAEEKRRLEEEERLRKEEEERRLAEEKRIREEEERRRIEEEARRIAEELRREEERRRREEEEERLAEIERLRLEELERLRLEEEERLRKEEEERLRLEELERLRLEEIERKRKEAEEIDLNARIPHTPEQAKGMLQRQRSQLNIAVGQAELEDPEVNKRFPTGITDTIFGEDWDPQCMTSDYAKEHDVTDTNADAAYWDPESRPTCKHVSWADLENEDGSWKGEVDDDGNRILPDGSRLGSDGNRILPDGSRILPDGSRVGADGNQIDPDGTEFYNGSAPDGKSYGFGGNGVGSDGVVLNHGCGKHVSWKDLENKDGSWKGDIDADGNRILPDGSRISRDGNRILPDGSRIIPDGSRIGPDGNRLDLDGTVFYNGREPDGKSYGYGGNGIGSNGVVLYYGYVGSRYGGSRMGPDGSGEFNAYGKYIGTAPYYPGLYKGFQGKGPDPNDPRMRWYWYPGYYPGMYLGTGSSNMFGGAGFVFNPKEMANGYEIDYLGQLYRSKRVKKRKMRPAKMNDRRHSRPVFRKIGPFSGNKGWENCVDCKYNDFCDNPRHKDEYWHMLYQDSIRPLPDTFDDCECSVCTGSSVHNGCFFRELLRLKSEYLTFDKHNYCYCSVCIPFKYRRMCLRQEFKLFRRDGEDHYYRLTDNTGDDGVVRFEVSWDSEDSDAEDKPGYGFMQAIALTEIKLTLTKEDKISYRDCPDCQCNGFCDKVRHKKIYMMLLRIDDVDFDELRDDCWCLVCEFKGAAHSGCAEREIRRLKYDLRLFDVRNLCYCNQCVPFKYRKKCLRQELKEKRRRRGMDMYHHLYN